MKRLDARWINRPVAVEPSRLDALLVTLQSWPFRHSVVEEFFEQAGRRERFPVQSGVAIIPVHGPLAMREDFFSSMMGWGTYQGVQRDLEKALRDPAVRAIALDIDSPGGEVSGAFDLADWIVAQRGTKPIWAIANEAAFSAAYAIAAAADRVVLSRSAGVGSVGIIARHVEFSKMDERLGITVTPVYAGARKNDLDDASPLTDTAREILQAEVDRLYELFVANVASARGMSEDVVRGSEAGLFFGENAVEAGFADAVASFDEAFAAMTKEPRRPRALRAAVREEATTMPDPNIPDPQVTMTTPPAAEPTPPSVPEPEEPVGATVVSLADVRRARGEGRAEAAQIVQACALAGVPTLAATLLAEEGMTLSTALQRIQVARGAGGPEIHSASAPGSVPDERSPRINTTAVYEKWNRRGKE